MTVSAEVVIIPGGDKIVAVRRVSDARSGVSACILRISITFLLFPLISAQAQTFTGWIQAKARDASTLAAIGGVEILLEDQNGRIFVRQRTDAMGEVLIPGLAPGDYALVMQKEGYSQCRVNSIRIVTGSASLVSVEMPPNKAGNPGTVILTWEGVPSDAWSSVYGSRYERERLDALPNAWNIWSLLQDQDISSVTNHIGEGGIDGGVPALVGVHGGTWTQNGYRWDGLNVTNPYEPGKPLTYPGYESIQEFLVSGSQHGAAVSASGAEFQLVSRRGGDTLRGQAEAYYLGSPFQSSNLDDRLRGFGYTTTPHFEHFPQGAFSMGGPLPGARAWSFFTSLEAQNLSKVIPGFAGTPAARVYSGLLRLDRAVTPRDSLSMLVSGQIARNSNLGAGPGIEPSATLHGNDRYELVQGHWTRRQSDRTVWDIAFGFAHSSPTDTLQAGITRPNYTRLFTGEMTGAAPVESDSALSRFSLRGQMQTIRRFPASRQHLLALGFDLEESLATEEQRVFQGLDLFLYPGNAPSEVAEFNTPSHAMQRLRELSFFAEDRLTIHHRIFLRWGANLDSSNASLPSQRSGAGPFAPARSFAGAGSVVSWTSLSPRLGLAAPFSTRLGQVRLFAGYARYYDLLPAAYADYANPTALGGRLYRWDDKNNDGIFQPGEDGPLLRVFGGPSSEVDPGLKRPFTDEWGIGLEHDIGRALQMSVRLLRRDTRHLVQTVNTGVPASAYTAVKVLDPGDDNVAGTSDDQVLTVFNQDPHTLGQDHYQLTNPPGLNARYKGLESNLTCRFAEHGYFSVSFTAYKSEGDGNPGNSELENDPGVIGSLFDNPNTSINARGRLFFDRAYMGKIAAYYRAPFGFQLGSVISYFDGLPFGRELIVPDFNQGPFFVMATPRGEPGGFRTQYNLNFDQRLSRGFEFGNLRMTVLMDVFNMLNSNKNLREADISGPQFVRRTPLDVQNPRAFRLGVRLGF